VGDAAGVAGFRLTELVAAVSLATDLGTGQPIEHALRTCMLSMAVADELGLDTGTAAEVHYVALLRFLGCTADASETARLAGGDNIAFLSAMAPVMMGSSREVARTLVRSLGRGRPVSHRARLVAGALGDPGGAARSLSAHCEVGARLAGRLGLGDGVVDALSHAYERWDGRGVPEGLAGEAIPIAVRVVVAARDAVLWQRLAGIDAAAEVLAARRGRAYDPAVVDAVHAVGVPAIDGRSVWDDVLAAEPPPVRTIGPVALDEALAALGDFADLRSAWTRGRSSRLAELAQAAGRAAGVPEDEVTLLHRAGMVADIGAVGVPTAVWERYGTLGPRVNEQVRLHPYLSERVLGRCDGLGPLAALAGSHHERLDGSGYHRGSTGAQLPHLARLLAAADMWTALSEHLPHRPAQAPGQARDTLRDEVTAGRLDREAVAAVLSAADEPGDAGPRKRLSHPGGLSDREVEVLRLIAQGLRNREVAARLFISPKTVGHHVAHIYAKIGVTTRPGAALFAMEHDLLRE
jgi:HD-GYP domain-containing protein (c-di-GMP phosphodiesterase class II)/DNA-binding CsgD family transcriptional regulator